jgi:hypothetical protein
MNIAIISDFNIAGQPTALMRAINKYTDHNARCIIAHDDSFAYDKDIILNKETVEEATDIAHNTDFFHFGRGIFNWPGVDFNKLLTKKNCCIKYYGSELRNNFDKIKKFHEMTGFTAITGTDWSITGRLPNSIYHLGSYFTSFGDQDELGFPTRKSQGEDLKICAGSAGSPLKGYDFLKQTVQELREEGVHISLDVLSGMSNNQCLRKKKEYHATFTSLHGAWGISGVESMFLGHVVLSCLDPWVMSLYPDNPTVLINRDNLKKKLKWLAEMSEDDLFCIGDETQGFAAHNFDTKTILKRYLYLFDLIMSRDKYLDGGQNPKEIYDYF